MYCVKIPLRVGLFGGGTDLPEFFNEEHGKVVGFTINRFIYIFSSEIESKAAFKYRLSYRRNEEVMSTDEIKHPLFKAILSEFELSHPRHITTMASLPSGAGLGSSSAFAVGLLALVSTVFQKTWTPKKLAMEAIRFERTVLGEAGGWQDQLHAAFGGVNSFRFRQSSFQRRSIDLSENWRKSINDSSYLVFAGSYRNAHKIEAKKLIEPNLESLRSIRAIADAGETMLRKRNADLIGLGELLSENWQLKKSLARRVSSGPLDETYREIMRQGAYGAKLCGAGGGGFFFVLANPRAARRIAKAAKDSSFTPLKIERNGVKCMQL